MKRFFVIILLFFSILKAVANPIPVSYVEISELQFSSDGSWALEIAVFPYAGFINAIWIKSNSGESKLQYFEFDGLYKLLVIESGDLTTPLSINPIQDSVIVTYNIENMGWWGGAELTYGYPNSEIRTPKTGQSIAAIQTGSSIFSITNSPTIGLENDTTGMMGTIRGIVYDVNGLPLSTMSDRGLTFVPLGSIFYPQSDGSYSTRYYSRDQEEIWSLNYRYGVGYHSVMITPIFFSMQPDSVLTRDIYLTEEILVGINEINNSAESILKIYPQPIKQQFNYEISIPIKSVETYMIFRNINGQELYRFLVTENNGVINLPDNIKAGFYILQLVSNKKNYATAKLIVQ